MSVAITMVGVLILALIQWEVTPAAARQVFTSVVANIAMVCGQHASLL